MKTHTYALCLILMAASIQLYAKPKARLVVNHGSSIHFSSPALEQAFYRYITKPGIAGSRSTEATLSRLIGRRTDSIGGGGIPYSFDSSNLSYSGSRGGDDNTLSEHQLYDQETFLNYQGGMWDNTNRTIQKFDSNNNIDTSIAQINDNGTLVNSTMAIENYDGNNHAVSIITYYLKTGSWVPQSEYLFTYDAQGYLLISTTLEYAGNTFVNYASDTFSYNAMHLVTRDIYVLSNDTVLVNNNRTTDAYDNNGNLIYDDYAQWQNGAWVYSDRDSDMYDASNKVLRHVHQYYSTVTGWNNLELETYTYDANENNLVYTDYYWAATTWDIGDETFSTYNSANNPISVLYLQQQGVGIVDTAARDTLIYTNNGGGFTGYTDMEWEWGGPAVWDTFSLDTYAFDANGNNILYEEQIWNGTGWGMSGDEQTAYTFNSYNQYVTESTATWGTTTWVPINNYYWWYETYQGVAGIAEVPLDAMVTSASPNPFSNSFTVFFNAESAGEATLKLYDINGRLLTGTTSTVNAGSNRMVWDADYTLPAGTYIYELSMGNAVSRGKVVSN